MTNKTILFIPDVRDINAPVDAFIRLLKQDGYISHNLLEIGENGMYELANVKRVIKGLNPKPDLVCIDGLVQLEFELARAIQPEQGEIIYDGKIMIYPSLNSIRPTEDVRKSGADFALSSGIGYLPLKEALGAIFDQKSMPMGFAYNVNKYRETKEGILVPLALAAKP